MAARLLAAVGSTAALDALAPVLAGEHLVTLAVRRPRGGVAELAPAGAVCDAVVVLDGDRLLLVPVADADRRPVANLASAPLADVDLGRGRHRRSPPAPTAVGRFEAALDEWLVLTAAALVGIGTAALDLGCAYATERQAFGAPIGSFQGVAHPLADDATDLDGARLLVAEGGVEPRRRGRPRAGSWRPWRSRSRHGPPRRPPTTPCTSTAATASCSSTTCSCTTGGPAAGPGCGATPRPAYRRAARPATPAHDGRSS